jgi:hypothetical protein
MLLCSDLGCWDHEWSGWIVRRGALVSPEGWEITVNLIMSLPLLRAQIAAYQAEQRKFQSIPEQPLPAEWPEWIGEMRA